MMTESDGAPETGTRTGQRQAGSKKTLAVLISGRGSNLKALIDACAEERVNGRITLVISNRPQAPGLDYARAAGIPHAVIDHREYADRAAFDQALGDRLASAAPDLIVLAGFMRVLTPGFVERFASRMVNIHPSLLPEFRGLDTHARALAAGAEQHGASVHFVTAELDGGPVLMQARVPVCAGDSADALSARVQAAEHRLYPAAVALICSGRIHAQGDRLWLDGEPLQQPLLLDSATETTQPCAGTP